MGFASAVVDYCLFLGRSMVIPWGLRRTLPRVSDQVIRHGVGALPVVLLCAVFIGLTTAVQTSYQLMGVVPKYFVGMGVSRMVLIELAPVLAAFIIAGRSASAMAAELGAMRNSDQIDALAVMGVNPYRFLCLPRIAGMTVCVPLLVVAVELVAVVTALAISTLVLDVSSHTFMYGVTHFFMPRDFFGGLVKAAVFGFIIGTNGCFFGFNVSGGAEGTGKAATRAVVASAVMILVVDFLVALAFFAT